MTINVALATSEGLVLGCDSIASVTEYFVNPFGCPREKGADGTLKITITPEDIVQQVTQTWAGVTKMFPLQGGSCPVAAVTAGLAKFCNRTMSSYANEFYAQRGGMQPIESAQGGVQISFVSGLTYEPICVSVEETAHQFLKFMRAHYEQHYAHSELPEEYRDGPLFLIGGYSKADYLPSLFRVNVQNNSVSATYAAGAFGLAWEGQSDKSKFATGVPTVGGRTHIGVITKRDGFRMLGEPALNHSHLGFA